MNGVRIISRCLALLSAIIVVGIGCSPQEKAKLRADQGPVRLLFVGDPFALTLEKNQALIEEIIGSPVDITLLRYGDTLESIHRNSYDYDSYYHIVSFDIMWLGELVGREALAELDDSVLQDIGFAPQRHYKVTIESNRYEGKLYGLPIQPHTELLWYRKDLLEQAGFSPPQNFEELLHQAKHFHAPEEDRYGIAWNALRGDALGQTIAHLYAAHGQVILDEHGNLNIDCEAGSQVAQLLLDLKDVSPPDILATAWDQRIDRFSKGEVAFTYGWAARNGLAETDRASRVRGCVGYAPPPVSRDAETSFFPHGQWSIGIPKNLPASEIDRAVATLEALSSIEVLATLLENGIGGLNRSRLPSYLALSNDPTASVSRKLAEEHKLSLQVRPPRPEWPELIRLCGVVFHDMLRGEIPPDEALMRAQDEGEALLSSR